MTVEWGCGWQEGQPKVLQLTDRRSEFHSRHVRLRRALGFLCSSICKNMSNLNEWGDTSHRSPSSPSSQMILRAKLRTGRDKTCAGGGSDGMFARLEPWLFDYSSAAPAAVTAATCGAGQGGKTYAYSSVGVTGKDSNLPEKIDFVTREAVTVTWLRRKASCFYERSCCCNRRLRVVREGSCGRLITRGLNTTSGQLELHSLTGGTLLLWFKNYGLRIVSQILSERVKRKF